MAGTIKTCANPSCTDKFICLPEQDWGRYKGSLPVREIGTLTCCVECTNAYNEVRLARGQDLANARRRERRAADPVTYKQEARDFLDKRALILASVPLLHESINDAMSTIRVLRAQLTAKNNELESLKEKQGVDA